MMALPRHLIDEVPIVSVFPVDLSLSLHLGQRKWLFQSPNCGGRSPKLTQLGRRLLSHGITGTLVHIWISGAVTSCAC